MVGAVRLSMKMTLDRFEAPIMVVCRVARNRRQPRAEAVGVAEVRDPPHGDQEDVLYEIVGFLARSICQKALSDPAVGIRQAAIEPKTWILDSAATEHNHFRF